MAVTPHSLSPLLPQVLSDFMLIRLWSDVLTSYDASGNRMVPMLARTVPSDANGGVSPDGKTITFLLRRGVKWQDGAPFTSADVALHLASRHEPGQRRGVSRNGLRRRGPRRHARSIHRRLSPRAPFDARILSSMLFGDGRVALRHLAGAPSWSRYRETQRLLPFQRCSRSERARSKSCWLAYAATRIELVANDAYYLGKPKLAADRHPVRTATRTTAVHGAPLARSTGSLEATPLLYRELQDHPDVSHRCWTPMNNFVQCCGFNTTRPVVSRPARAPRDRVLDRASPSLVRDLFVRCRQVADGDILRTSCGPYPRGVAFATFTTRPRPRA